MTNETRYLRLFFTTGEVFFKREFDERFFVGVGAAHPHEKPPF
jgi:hypothetical protein